MWTSSFNDFQGSNKDFKKQNSAFFSWATSIYISIYKRDSMLKLLYTHIEIYSELTGKRDEQ